MRLFFKTLLLSLILVGGVYSQEPSGEINSPLINIDVGQDDALGQAIEALSVSSDSGLTAQQRLDLIKDLGQMRTANSAINSDKAHASKFDAEGFLAILLIFSTPILAIYISYRKKERVYQTIDSAINKGIEVPSSLLEAVEKSAQKPSSLQRGLVWSAVGLGVLLAGSLIASFNEASIGFIPLFIGLAYLISSRLENTDNTAT